MQLNASFQTSCPVSEVSFQSAKSNFLWHQLGCGRSNELCAEFSETVGSESLLVLTEIFLFFQTEVNKVWRRGLLLFYRLSVSGPRTEGVGWLWAHRRSRRRRGGGERLRKGSWKFLNPNFTSVNMINNKRSEMKQQLRRLWKMNLFHMCY